MTRDNIIEGMLWLVEGAQPNDSLFFHYSGRGLCLVFVFFCAGTCLFCFCLLLRFCYTHLSGHGSQSTDYDGDEVDGSDETICPVDYKVLIQGAFCVTQLKLYTLYKLSSPIFCCL